MLANGRQLTVVRRLKTTVEEQPNYHQDSAARFQRTVNRVVDNLRRHRSAASISQILQLNFRRCQAFLQFSDTFFRHGCSSYLQIFQTGETI
jgi:hypothetical protein